MYMIAHSQILYIFANSHNIMVIIAHYNFPFTHVHSGSFAISVHVIAHSHTCSKNMSEYHCSLTIYVHVIHSHSTWLLITNSRYVLAQSYIIYVDACPYVLNYQITCSYASLKSIQWLESLACLYCIHKIIN